MTAAGILLPRRLRENLVALSFLQCVNYAAPLVTVPWLVRTLGPANYGLVSFSQALILYFDTFSDFGFNLSATREIAEHPGSSARDVQALCRTFWTTLAAKVILMSIGAMALALVVVATPRLRLTGWVFAASFLNTVGTSLLPVWLFQGLRQMRVLTAAQAVARLATIPAIFFFVRRPEDYLITAAIQGVVPVISALVLVPWIWPRVGRRCYVPAGREVSAAWKRSWPLFVSNSSLLLSTSSTAVILGFVAGNVEVGYYSVAEKLVKALAAVFAPITQALYPHIVSLRSESPERALRFVRGSFLYVAGLGLAATAATWLFAAPVGRIMFGASFGPAITVLRYLAPMPFLAALISLLGTQTMIAFGMDRAVTRIVFRAMLLTLPLIAGASYLAGARGAALASSAGAFVMAAAMAATLHKHGLAVWTPDVQPAVPEAV